MPLRRRDAWFGPLAWVGLATIGVELALTGADLGLWGGRFWRNLAFDLGGFRPGLLLGEGPAFWAQPATMFLTYGILHTNIWHLLGNMFAVAMLGPNLQRRIGAVATLAVYLVATVCGGLGFALLAPADGVMVGASGAAFGLAGGLAALRGSRLGPVALELVVLNVALWFVTAGALAWQAHLGGFLAGMFLVRLLRAKAAGVNPG